MKRSLALLALTLAVSLFGQAQNKGTCAPFAGNIPVTTPRKTPSTPQPSGGTYAGSVTLLAVVTDTGYVCDVRVLHGVNKDLDARARKAALSWHFQPATKNGRPATVSVTMAVDLWRNNTNHEVVPLIASTPSAVIPPPVKPQPESTDP